MWRGGFVLDGDYLIHSALCCSVEAVCCISVASVVRAHSDWLCVLRLRVRHWLESSTGEIWLVGGRQGKASLCCYLFFFLLPAVQTVHMFQVNKPGVGTSAAVFRAEISLDVVCFSLCLSKSWGKSLSVWSDSWNKQTRVYLYLYFFFLKTTL